MRRDKKIDWLRSIPGFERLSRSEIKQLATAADRAVAPAQRVMTTQGGRGVECFVVSEGELEVRRDGEVINRIGPGSVVGEISLLDNAVRNADVIALTDIEVAVFDPRSFRSALETNPEFRSLVEHAAESHRV